MGREVRSCKGLRELNRWREVLNLRVLSTHRNGEQFISYLVTSLSKLRRIKAMLEIKWSHFDDYSVKGINNNPNPHCLSQRGLGLSAKLAFHWQHSPCSGALQEGWLSHPGHCLSQSALRRLQAQLQDPAALQTSLQEHCRARPGMDRDGSSWEQQQGLLQDR